MEAEARSSQDPYVARPVLTGPALTKVVQSLQRLRDSQSLRVVAELLQVLLGRVSAKVAVFERDLPNLQHLRDLPNCCQTCEMFRSSQKGTLKRDPVFGHELVTKR